MEPIEVLQAIGICNNTNDRNTLEDNIRKILQSRNPYYICDFVENVNKAHKPEYLKLFEDEIISIGDIVHSYEFMFLLADMRVSNFNLKRFEELIRQSGNAKLMMYSLAFVEGIDTESMLQSLYDTQNAKYIEQLSTDEEYAFLKVSESEEYKERLRTAKAFYYFPKSLENVKPEDIHNTKGLIYNVINMPETSQEDRRKKAFAINELANHLEYLIQYHPEENNIETLRRTIEILQSTEAEVATDEPLHLYEFAASVKIKDKTPIITQVIQNGSAKFIHYCLEYVPDLSEENKRKLERALESKHHNKYKVENQEKDIKE